MELDSNTVLTVGRSTANDVCLSDMMVSRRQFALECNDNTWTLRDLSGKGTWVNHDRVKELVLENGSVITLGSDIRAFFSQRDLDYFTRSTDLLFPEN